MRMDSWTFFVVFSLCFSTHLHTGLAGQVFKRFESKAELEALADDTGANNDTNNKWQYSNGRKALATDVRSGGASWFVTKPLNLGDTSYLEIEASCRKGKIDCKNPFQLEIYGTNQSAATPFKNYKFIQNVVFEKRSANNATIEKSYPRLYILVRTSTASSFYIHSISIRYYFCKETTIYNTHLSKVYSLTTNVEIHLRCPNNAVASDGNSTNTTVKCTPKGNWTFEKCECNKGFHSGTGPDKRCSNCPDDYYKNTIGDTGCLKCPDGKTNTTEQTGCKCKKDRYVGDNENGPCYAVPSKIEFINIPSTLDETMNITWKKATNSGGFNGSITYTVEVYNCDESKCNSSATDVQISAKKTGLTYVMISNLVRQKYKIKVISMNSLKNVPTDKWKFAETTFPLPGTTPTGKPPTGTGPPGKNESIVVINTSNRMILIVISVIAGLLLIVLIVVLVKFKRQKSPQELSTPVVIPLEITGTSRESHLPTDQEPGYEAVGRVVRDLATNTETSAEANAGHEVSANDEHYERISQYEEPGISSQNLDYTELDRSRRRNSGNDGEYQKLQKLDSDCVIPAHERRESYEDMKTGKNLPGYMELDQNKRETEETQSATYQSLN